MASKRYYKKRYKGNKGRNAKGYQNSYSSKSKRTRLKKTGIFVLVLALIFGALVTVNTFVTISENLPTWKSVLQEIKGYFDPITTDPDNTKTSTKVQGEAQVHFIDVGQGNSTLILSDGMAVLIDAGEVDKGSKVVEYLKAQGVSKLDYIVATHPHSDHIGGMDDVIKAVPADNIIMPKLRDDIVPTTRVYEELIDAITAHGLNVIEAKVGSIYELGGGKMTVLGPSGDFDDLNEMSVAIQFKYGKSSFLTTGDMDKKSETALLGLGADVESDVFLLSHHGSKTGNCDDFLNAVKASYYVAQVGLDNEYHHPSPSVVSKVLNRGGTLYRSDVDGDIVFKTNGENLTKVEN